MVAIKGENMSKNIKTRFHIIRITLEKKTKKAGNTKFVAVHRSERWGDLKSLPKKDLLNKITKAFDVISGSKAEERYHKDLLKLLDYCENDERKSFTEHVMSGGVAGEHIYPVIQRLRERLNK
jgi:hypothetical protein